MPKTLDPYEQEILDAFEAGQLKSVLTPEELKKAQEAAKNFMAKTERVNLRLSRFDLDRIKRIAAIEGIPYQTLMSSILHKYAMQYLKIK